MTISPLCLRFRAVELRRIASGTNQVLQSMDGGCLRRQDIVFDRLGIATKTAPAGGVQLFSGRL